MSSFSENVRVMRKLRGLTQVELAVKSEVAVAQISRFESGKQTPNISNLVKISDALRISTDWLLDREGYYVHTPHELLSEDDLDLMARFEQLLLDRGAS